ncbi:MAG: hypothetical protein ISP74_06175 [Bacteroidia bacterium]|nr:hypothetical protein [Bacteroidia bacterium]
MGEVAGNGNSQHKIEYSYTDASVSKVQNTVYYRLKQVDFDGAYEYSDIRVVRFDAVGNDMQLVAYPNPMNDELNVMLSTFRRKISASSHQPSRGIGTPKKSCVLKWFAYS